MGLDDDDWPSPEEFGKYVQKVLRPTRPPEMQADHWRVMCEFCEFAETGISTRQKAVAAGHEHVKNEHGDDPEWTFRVQGIKR